MTKPTRREIELKLAQTRAKAPKPPAKSAHVLYEKPTPKVSKLKKGKTLTAAEKAAFLASRPDLTKK